MFGFLGTAVGREAELFFPPHERWSFLTQQRKSNDCKSARCCTEQVEGFCPAARLWLFGIMHLLVNVCLLHLLEMIKLTFIGCFPVLLYLYLLIQVLQQLTREGPSQSPVCNIGNSGTERLSKVPKDTARKRRGLGFELRAPVSTIYPMLLCL